MNLHGAASVVSAINPMISATLKQGTGYSTADDGTRSPSYAADTTINIQLQGMSEAELRQINELNLGGILRKVYAAGALASMDRSTGDGGDLLVINSVVWLVVHVLEQWPDWSSAVIQKQAD